MSLKDDYNWGLIIVMCFMFMGIGMLALSESDGISFGEKTITTTTCDYDEITSSTSNCITTIEVIKT